jgi:dTDP-4-amino-4,6-dideoxygalactose transaminase
MGPEVIAFERELAAFMGAADVVTVNSCTSALFLALLARGIGPGDEVICPSMTWCSTANAALYLGAKPVFCDVDADTMCVTPELLARHETERTRGAMVVHFGGFAADVAAIREALRPQAAIVEDAAHALGAKTADGRPIGASDHLPCFSFYANKNLSTGEGGAIAVRDERVGERLRSLRLHALPVDAWKRYSSPKSLLLSPDLSELGYKMNFTDLQACIGRVQLRRQEEFARRRMEIAQHYVGRLAAIPGLRVQKGVTSPAHSRHLFVIRLPLESMRMNRDEFILALRARNIGASIHYAPLHRMPLYGETSKRLPITEDLALRIVTLPISASMTLDDADYVASCVEELLS